MDISLNPVENLDIILESSNPIDISLIPVSELLDYEIDHIENIDTELSNSENLEVDIRSGIAVRGSIVIPNPPDEPTDDLETVKIDYDTYRIKDGQLSDWARQERKPSYTATEVGAVDINNELHLQEIDRMFLAVFGG